MVLLLSHDRLLQPHEMCLPGSSVHEISQVRILEWVAISFYSNIHIALYFGNCYMTRIIFFNLFFFNLKLIFFFSSIKHDILTSKIAAWYSVVCYSLTF